MLRLLIVLSLQYILVNANCISEITPNSKPDVSATPYQTEKDSYNNLTIQITSCHHSQKCSYLLFDKPNSEYLYYSNDISNVDLAVDKDFDTIEILCDVDVMIPPSMRRQIKKKMKNQKEEDVVKTVDEKDKKQWKYIKAALLEKYGAQGYKKYNQYLKEVKKCYNKKLGLPMGMPLSDEAMLFDDTVLGKDQLENLYKMLTETPGKRRRRKRSAPNAIITKSWPSSNINVAFNSDLTSSTVKSKIRSALAELEKVTCLRFTEVAAGANVDRIEFRTSAGCSAEVGYQTNQPNSIWIGSACGIFNIVHECLHALGLHHEQARPDRNNYVNVIYDNIKTDRVHNFAMKSEVQTGQNYDYYSVMHYPKWAFVTSAGLNSIECIGSGTATNNANTNSIGQRDHLSSGDIAVINKYMCSADQTSGQQVGKEQIRLMNLGVESTEAGRVEVLHNGVWGTICDDSWSPYDAIVACYMLGHRNKRARAYIRAAFGQGTGAIHMDEMRCTNNEEYLSDCPKNDWGDNDCSHSEDAGVDCRSSGLQVQLVGQSSAEKGRLEVSRGGPWGTVCSDGWDSNAAKVVCKMLGYGDVSKATAFKDGTFGAGSASQPIHLDDMSCDGTESSLDNCVHMGWGNHNCDHSKDVGIDCSYAGAQISATNVRLVGGSNANEGRVEVYIDGAWGTVCDDGWGTLEAQVVCKELGLDYKDAVYKSRAYFGRGTDPIKMDDVACTGSESSLLNCPYNADHNCVHGEDAGVICA